MVLRHSYTSYQLSRNVPKSCENSPYHKRNRDWG